MDTMGKYLISKDNGRLQIPYSEYKVLLEKKNELEKIMQVKSTVLANLQRFLEGNAAFDEDFAGDEYIDGDEPVDTTDSSEMAADECIDADEPVDRSDSPEMTADESIEGDEPVDTTDSSEPEEHHDKVSVEFSPEEPDGHTSIESKEQSAAEAPPIKKDIEEHFNSRDGSGRLLNVFKQYYTCLNEMCHGTVRVTMKDGICSLWNYDEWEEFAFIDILDDELRIAVDTRYTNDLSSLNFCEVARLLAARRNLIAIQVGDLNKTMLGVLTKAFGEVGQTAG